MLPSHSVSKASPVRGGTSTIPAARHDQGHVVALFLRAETADSIVNRLDQVSGREIAVGAVSVSEVEIVRGLAEGERIVVSDTSLFEGAGTVLIR